LTGRKLKNPPGGKNRGISIAILQSKIVARGGSNSKKRREGKRSCRKTGLGVFWGCFSSILRGETDN